MSAAASPSGRKLTQTGRLTLADARTLVDRLGTGDVIDPVIGDRVSRTTSSEELTGLFIVLEWARAAGSVRRQGAYIVAVKKRAALLDRPLDLLARMVEVLGELGPAVCPPGWAMSMLRDNFATGVKALLTTMSASPEGLDVQAVSDRVWDQVSPWYRTDHLTDEQLDRWRRMLTRDVWRTVQLLAETGLVTRDEAPGSGTEDREASLVQVTTLGRWAIRHTLGGPAEGDPTRRRRTPPRHRSPPHRPPARRARRSPNPGPRSCSTWWNRTARRT